MREKRLDQKYTLKIWDYSTDTGRINPRVFAKKRMNKATRARYQRDIKKELQNEDQKSTH